MRKVIEFDPQNAQHRSWYKTFLDTRAWSHCPVIFNRGRDFSELPHYLNTVLIAYYMNKDHEIQEKEAIQAQNAQNVV